MDGQLKDRIDGVIQSQLAVDADAITPEAHLDGDLGADSLDSVELVMRLEEEFSINIDEDRECPKTVADVHRLVVEKLAAVA